MQPQAKLDETTVLSGCVLGFVVGGLTALFRLPSRILRGRRSITDPAERQKLLRQIDPITNSIDTGKALAEQRRQQLGIEG